MARDLNAEYTLTVKHDRDTNEYYLEFPQDVLENLGWVEGDEIEWLENSDGSFSLKRICKETTSKGAIQTNILNYSVNNE